MQTRQMIIATLAGGPLIGALLGLAIDPVMKPSPEPAWHKIAPDPVLAQPQHLVAAGPQDLSPTWYIDRMPTWKRRAAMRDAAQYDPLGSDYFEPLPEPEPEPLDERPVITIVRGTTAAEVMARRDTSPLDAAAEQAEAAAIDARTAVPGAQSAAGEDEDRRHGDPVPGITLTRQAGI